jgi:hypothetical protein
MFSEIWRHKVITTITDVSEEHITSIFGVERLSEDDVSTFLRKVGNY